MTQFFLCFYTVRKQERQQHSKDRIRFVGSLFLKSFHVIHTMEVIRSEERTAFITRTGNDIIIIAMVLMLFSIAYVSVTCTVTQSQPAEM